MSAPKRDLAEALRPFAEAWARAQERFPGQLVALALEVRCNGERWFMSGSTVCTDDFRRASEALEAAARPVAPPSS